MYIANSHFFLQIVAESLETHCKCHGVSGSCSIKTCWRGLPQKFYEIGEKLMKSYVAAEQVHNSISVGILEERYRYTPALLYLTESPNYCDHDPSNGSYGTKGR